VQPDLESLVIIAALAVLAPILADVPRRFRVAIVVVEIVLGIVVGPDVLDLVEPDAFIDALANLGLAALFFLAGSEIELEVVRGRPMRLAAGGWLVSLAIGVAAAVGLEATGIIDDPEIVAIALATTALGVLVPILRDAGILRTPFGTMVMAAGSIGEVGPIILVSVFLTATNSSLTAAILLAAFVVVAAGLAIAAPRIHIRTVERLIGETMEASGQLAVRICLLLLATLVFIAVELDLELVLGAFSAGVIYAIATRGAPGTAVLKTKLDAIAFGFLVPVFFIRSGLTFDLEGLLDSPSAMAQLPIFLGLFLLARGLPAIIEARHLGREAILPLGFLTASTLPLVVTICEAGVRNGELSGATSAALVGAAMLTVLIFPAVALALMGRRQPRSDPSDDPEPEAL
jgi:Kef-type K+ transport system membrane component KefB